ncbi:MAG: glycosyltransferase family 2 protein [Candidatus Berkelbacteria bacterium]
MPKISFVMPTKNRADLIGKSIQSIIDQTEEDWELIIIDDHSDDSDRTEEIVTEFQDDRIKYYRMPEDWSGGIAEARNFGNQWVDSPIIAVADSDDLSKPERARLTIEAFEKNNCDVFYGQIEILNKESGQITTRESGKYQIKNFSLDLIKDYNPIAHGSTAYKTELAYDFPYNSFFKIAEDYDFFTRLAKAGKKFYFCNKIIYHYISHESNISKADIPGNFGKLIKVERKWIKADKRPILEKISHQE